MKTLPSGAMCNRGKSGRAPRPSALKSAIDSQAVPFHSCETLLMGCCPPGARKLPEHANTLPSGKLTAVGYHRPPFMGSMGVHLFASGS